MLSLTGLPPLSLYIHVPWCVKKCPYCDFNSHKAPDQLPQQAYVDRLIDNLTEQLPLVWGRQVHSIFIGGGTPSLLSVASMEQIMSAVRSLIPVMPNAEITLEANPGTAEAEKFAGFFAAGINRLSIGVQSLSDEHLTTLGRIHNSSEALAAIKMAQQAGFDRINVDLMHGLPNQSLQDAQTDLAKAIDTGVTHLSWYQLTLEPNTLFYQQPPTLPEDDQLRAIQDAGEQQLADAGLHQYETSAYAKSADLQSRHNLNYWQFGDYLAIGAGAHGKLTLPAEQQIIRYHMRRHPKDYLDREKTFEMGRQAIAVHDLPLEFMMNALRLIDGVPEQYFFERTGLGLTHIKDRLDQAYEKGLLESGSGQLKPTDLGRRFLNELLELFMLEDNHPLAGQIPITEL